MKALIYLLCAGVFLFSNTRNETPLKSSAEQQAIKLNKLKLNGTWELVDYYNYDNNVVIDTYQNREGYRQVKMFTDTKIMWSRQVPRDSIEYFGYGSYEIEEGQLVETLEYGSESMLRVIDTMRIFSFELILKENSFSQIQIGPEGDRVFSENYIRIE